MERLCGGRRSCSVICEAVIAELLCQGDVWIVEIARRPVFSRAKWLPASMWGTSSVRWRVRLGLVWRSSVPQCQRCAEVIFERLLALCHGVWWSRLPCCIGIAASKVLADDGEVLCASFVVRSSTGKYFVKLCSPKYIVLGSILCSTK